MKYRFLSLLVCCFLFTLASKNSQAKVEKYLDSIETSLEHMREDSNKVRKYGDLFYQFEFEDSMKARDFVTRSLVLAQKLNYQDGLANTYMQFGFLSDDQGKYDQAIIYYEKSLAIKIALDDQMGMAIMNNNIGIIYKEQGRYPEALEMYHRAIAIAEKASLKGPLALAYNNIGILQDDQKNYTEAISFYQKALGIAKEMGNKLGMAGSYNNLGIIYVKEKEHEKALEYFQKSLEIYAELGGIQPSEASTCNNIGLVYFDHPDLEASAKESYQKSMEYYKTALDISEHIGDQEGITASYINMGNALSALNEYDQGNNLLNKALELAKKIGAPYRQKEAYQGLSSLYEKQGKYALSLENYKYYTETKDSLFNEEKSKDLGKLEAKHEFESAEVERKREEEARIAEALTAEGRRNNLQYSGILIFIVLLFTGVFFLGRFSIPIRLAEGMIFFAFLLFFEFTLVLLDPYIEEYSSGAPAMKLAFNALLAAAIFPLHSFFEDRLKGRVIKNTEFTD